METPDMSSFQSPLLNDDVDISDDLIGQLHRATEHNVLDLVAVFTPRERAKLAMFCYHKSHWRQIGLAIAATCDLNSLISEYGFILGEAVFTQSRERPKEPTRTGVRLRPTITLARSAGGYRPPLIDLDDVPQSTCSAA